MQKVGRGAPNPKKVAPRQYGKTRGHSSYPCKCRLQTTDQCSGPPGAYIASSGSSPLGDNKGSLGHQIQPRPWPQDHARLPSSFLNLKGPALKASLPTAFRHHVCGVFCALALLCLRCSIERQSHVV